MLSYSEATDRGGSCRSIARRLLVIFSLAPPSSFFGESWFLSIFSKSTNPQHRRIYSSLRPFDVITGLGVCVPSLGSAPG
jgi:hypothetical protein